MPFLHYIRGVRRGGARDTVKQLSKATPERRRRPRTGAVAGDSVFVELRHTFGPVRKTVCKVVELDEFGLSFLVPVADGYFPPDTPLQYTLVNGDLSRIDGAGFVRYYHPVADAHGGLHYKIGIETNARYRDTAGGHYAIRPERLVLEGKEYRRAIVFEVDGVERAYELIDISRYSAAFHWADAGESTLFRLSRVIGPVRVFIDKHQVFDGSVTVTRVYDDAQRRRRVVVEPRGRLFDVEAISKVETRSAARLEIENVVQGHVAFEEIDSGFKAAVADLRCVLEDYRRICEAPRIGAGEQDQRAFLEEISGPFCERVDSKVTGIDDVVQALELTQEQHSVYRSYYQKHLLNLLLASPVNHRAYFKPEGYPGDYETIRLIHQDPFTGQTLFARLMNCYTVGVSAAMVARKRTEYLAEKVRAIVEGSPKSTVEVLSIACGPALEIDLLMRNYPRVADRISLTLLDQEIHALRFAQDNLYSHRITYESRIAIELIHSGLEGFLRNGTDESYRGKYDFVYAFGLFDYFDRNVARFVLRHLLTFVAPGGMALISNVSLDGLRYRSYAEFGMEWYLVYRSREEMAELCEGGAYKVYDIEGGVMKFLDVHVA